MLLPALSKAKVKAKTVNCIGNLKQLTTAWLLYADDNEDNLARNWLGTSAAWVGGNVRTASGATNTDAIASAKLYPYTKSLAVYRCPAADHDIPNVLRTSPGLPGGGLARNYSIGGRMGGADAADAQQFGVPDTTYVLPPEFPVFKRLTLIQNPGPSAALVFVDESINTIDDGYFAMQLNPIWQDSPTTRHSRGGTLSFADGHVERWGWRAVGIEQDLNAPVVSGGVDTTADLQRFQDAVATR
jgi:prepilin-type processing-associated H-X9-DG protein